MISDFDYHDTAMNWLSQDDYSTQQHDIVSRRHKDTGQWFLNSPKVKNWLEGSEKTLFCQGIPGAGKTMMVAIMVDHLDQTIRGDDISVAYLYCNYRTRATHTTLGMLSSLLKQLTEMRPELAGPVTQLYDRHYKRKSRPSLDDVSEALASVCSKSSTSFFLVDALDECTDVAARNQLLERLSELQVKQDVRLLLTSRPIPDIMQRFQSKPMIEIRAKEGDLRQYVAGQTIRLPNCIQRDEELQNAVQRGIAKSADGM